MTADPSLLHPSTHDAEVLRTMAQLSLGLSVAVVPVGAWVVGLPTTLACSGVLVVSCLATLEALRRGATHGASYGFLVAQFVQMIAVMAMTGGLSGFMAPYLVSLPVLGALLDGWRGALVTQSLVTLGAVGMYLLGDPSTAATLPLAADLRLQRATSYIVATTGGALIAAVALQRLRQGIGLAEAYAQGAAQASEAKSVFLANISHELRTPLNAILGYTELMLDDLGQGPVRDDLQRIHASGRRLLSMVGDVLELARLEAGRLQPSPQRHQLLGLVLASFADTQPRAIVVERGLEPVELWTDASMFSQVLQHLTDGAKGAFVTLERGRRIRIASGDFASTLGRAYAERIGAVLGLKIYTERFDGLPWVVVEVPEALTHPPHPQASASPRRRPWEALLHPPLPEDPTLALEVRLAHRAVLLMTTISVCSIPFPLLIPGLIDRLWLLPPWLLLELVVLSAFALGYHRLALSWLLVGVFLTISAMLPLVGGLSSSTPLYIVCLPVFAAAIRGRIATLWAWLATVLTLSGLALSEDTFVAVAPPLDARLDIAVSMVLAPLFAAGYVALLRGSLHEALQRAADARQRAEDADAAKDTLLEAASHELRTPMTVIKGYGEMLMEELPDEELRDDLTRVLDACTLLLAIVDDLIDMSTLEMGNVTLELRPVDLSATLTAACSVVRPMIDANHNTLDLEPPPPDLIVLADEQRLQQILINLLSNAAKFTQDGRVSVVVDVVDARVRVRVQDTGIGIASEALSTLFVPFRQAHDAAPGQYGGTGLGLAISRQLAQLMGGDITASSELGRGSTFCLSVPVASARRRPRSASPDPLRAAS